MARNFQNALGGTGFQPVVLGVPPETVCGMNAFGFTRAQRQCQPQTKSGETPDFTGGTPVPPFFKS
jgi:hypothetical protein